MDYDDFVRGAHLGVFPSAYEPWGYTPLECIAYGVPAVSSDLAGFGRYVQTHDPDHDRWGAYIVQRGGRSFHESAAELTEHLLAFCRATRHERIVLRNAVADHAEAFDWSKLADAYDQVHLRARVLLRGLV
jgi:glycogen(starch) synthase